MTPVTIASYLLVFLLCVVTLIYGLLPGLLAACLGYLLAVVLAGEGRTKGPRLSPALAASVVVLLPLVALGMLLASAKGMAFGGLKQYQALLYHLAGTVLEIREKLPADLAIHLPDELTEAQVWLANYLKSKARALTGFGTAGLHGLLLAYVGLVVGALIEGTSKAPTSAPLRFEVRQRASAPAISSMLFAKLSLPSSGLLLSTPHSLQCFCWQCCPFLVCRCPTLASWWRSLFLPAFCRLSATSFATA